MNAGLLAAQILAISDPRINQEIQHFRESLHDQIIAKDNKLINLGTNEYLNSMKPK